MPLAKIMHNSEIASAPREAIHAEQMRILYNHLPLSVVGSTSVGVALAALLWPSVNTLSLSIWLLPVLLMGGVRLYHFWQFRHDQKPDDRARAMARTTIICSTLLGLLWAWMPLHYFQPDSFLIISNIGLFMVGMVAGALVTQAVYMPSLYAFLIPISIASATALAFQAGAYAYLAIFSLIYSVIAIGFSQRVHQMFLDVIKTRFANDDLLIALTEEKRLAEEANRAKSAFLASASHDVRQPLHAMALYINMLKDDPTNLSIVHRLDEALENLETLYSRILEISQLDTGGVEPKCQPLDLSATVASSVVHYQPLATEQQLSLTFSATEATWVRSDLELLQRILDNLLSNAIRYTQPRGHIEIEVLQQQDRAQLTIVDTGIGIPDDQLENIFDEYVQVHNPERDREKGMGLGLSIVKRLCELLGHDVRVDSIESIGTTFTLSFETTPPPITDAPNPTSLTHPTQHELSLEGAQILVIDDDVGVRDAICEQLSRWGCSAQSMLPGASFEGLLLPDLILADFRLPGEESGVEMVARINQHFAKDNILLQIPAIIITGDTAPASLAKLNSSGYLVLHKPVQGPKLQRSLVTVLTESLNGL